MKKKPITVEDQINQANIAWDGVKKDISNSIVDRNRIVLAMTMLNSSHKRSIGEKKRYLIS